MLLTATRKHVTTASRPHCREAGVAPNVFTYSSVAKGYAASGRLPEAQRVLLEMDAAGVTPNVRARSRAKGSFPKPPSLRCTSNATARALQRGS
eukprot:6671270-Prymnesium_polylepis.1